jgi:hypothetical protein
MAALRLKLAACTLTLGILTGCTPATPSTPPPEPSPTCTPEAGGPPTPCTQYQYDQMIAKDKLYTQAEAVYRKYLTEDERINRAGGVTQPTPVLLETTTGDYLKNSMDIYRDLHRIHATAEGGTYQVDWIRRDPGEAMHGSVVTMKVCTDTTSIMMGSKGTHPEPGLIMEETGYFVPKDGLLKLAYSQFQEVGKC